RGQQRRQRGQGVGSEGRAAEGGVGQRGVKQRNLRIRQRGIGRAGIGFSPRRRGGRSWRRPRIGRLRLSRGRRLVCGRQCIQSCQRRDGLGLIVGGQRARRDHSADRGDLTGQKLQKRRPAGRLVPPFGRGGCRPRRLRP